MEQLQSLMDQEPGELLLALPAYQQNLIKELLNGSEDYLGAADNWLSTKPANTAGFGGAPNSPVLFREVLLDEIEKYLCGRKYQEDRKRMGSTTKVALGAMSHAIGASLGVAGAYILPVVVLLIMSFGKVPLNAFCEMRKKIREQRAE